MIRLFLIFSLLICFTVADDYFDKNPDMINKYDLELMKEFDKLVYELSDTNLKSLDINAIYIFIQRHKNYITDYSLLQIDFKAGAGIDTTDYGDKNTRKKEYTKAAVQLVYPLFDPKSKKDIKNKKLDYNFKILNDINKYAKLRDDLIAKERELKFNRLIQIKEKLQVKKAIKYLDDKLKTLEEILNLQNEILNLKSSLKVQRLVLLNYVKPSYREKLKRLLK